MTTHGHPTPEPLWRPTAALLEDAPVSRFMSQLAAQGIYLDDYRSLWQWSVDELPTFWAAVWDFFGLDDVSGYDEVLADASMPGARWFTGARLNFAERCLAAGADEKVAIIAIEEGSEPVETTYRELRRQVAALAATLRRLGVRPGDHVAGYLPNTAETVVAVLATASVGAVWTSAAPEFGTPSVLDRLTQVRPVVLVAAGSYHFGGRVHDRTAEVHDIVADLPSLHGVVTVGPATAWPDVGGVRFLGWDAALGTDADPDYADTAFDDPLWVLWSSGTTGRPKGIVQGHGGVTVELLKALALGCDIREDDRFFFLTSAGWMVWNFMVGGLLLGATIVCYGGSPGYPDLDGPWKVAAKTGATVVGVGAAYLVAGHKGDRRPGERYDLGGVRTLLQTGSTLPDEAWYWVCERALPGVWLQSVSGGTDVCSALAGASALLPVYAGRLAAPALGCDLQAWDEQGRRVVGEQGELVICQPMPSMPLCFVEDPDGERYREAYFAMYPGVWRHGDWVTVHDDLSLVIGGRSDATLNRMGVRLGSADIYGVVDNLPEIADSLVIGMEEPGGGYYLPLFVVPAEGVTLTDELVDRINREIRTTLSPRHVPDAVIEAPAVPRTLTGKRLEVPVKRLLQGGPATEVQAGSITHPEALEWYVEHGRERRRRLAP